MSDSKSTRTEVLSHEEVQRKIQRIVHQLHEQNHLEKKIFVVGIAKRGMQLAERLSTDLQNEGAFDTTLVEMKLDKKKPFESVPSLSIDLSELNGEVVVLVDDVLQSGRTLMQGAAHLVSASLKRLTTVVLVDRRHRSFPIRADIVGLTLSTTMQDHIRVEFGKRDKVYLD